VTASGEGPLAALGVGIRNPPGLPAISYRVGTYDTFLAGMLARLRTGTIDDADLLVPLKPLANLEIDTRHDWMWALLESWAVVGDVLTFYQERIANEGYLRTAVEAQSVLRLVQLLGYAPQPGIAGAADLAFTVLSGRRLPPGVTVPAGAAVKSLPVDGQLPQVFEIPQALSTRAVWSFVKPVVAESTRPQRIGPQAAEILLQGRVSLRPGTPLLVALAPDLPGGAARMSLRAVQSVAVERAKTGVATRTESGAPAPDTTTVTLEPPPGDPPADGEVLQVFVLRRRDHLFGYNAPQWSALPDSVKQKYGTRKGGIAVSSDLGESWQALDAGLPTTAVSALAYTPAGELVAGTAAGLYRWTGGEWKAPSSGLGKVDVRVLAATAAGHLFAGTAQGVFRSTDGGDTWSNLTAVARIPKKGLLVALAGRSGVVATIVARLRAVVQALGLGQPQAQPRLPSTALAALLVTGDASGTSLFAATGQGILRSDGTGGGWLPVNRGLPKTDAATGLTSLVVHALAAGAAAGEVFAGTDQGVFVSRDLGGSWQAASSGLPRARSGGQPAAPVTPVTALAAASDSRLGTSALFAATGRGVFRSTDAGASWQGASAGLPTGSGSAQQTPLAVSLLALYADARTLATYLFAATAEGLFRSDDLGDRWRAVGDEPPGAVTALAGSAQGLAVATPFDGFVETDWPGFQLQNGDIDLSAVDSTVLPGSWVALQQSRTQTPPLPPLAPRVGIYAAKSVNTVARSGFGTTAQVTRIGVQDDGQLGLFDLRQTDALVDSLALKLAAVPVVAPMSQAVVEVDLPASEAPPPGARVAVSGKPIRARLSTGESVQVLAMPAAGSWWVRDASGAVRPLALDADAVSWEPAADGDEGTAEVVATSPGQLADGAATPNAVLAFSPPLATPFDPATVTLNANVGQATQGETVPREVLGSGDASRPFQRFTLMRKPLTYVRSDDGDCRSTLEVWVGGVRWAEVPTLCGTQPSSRVYAAILDEAGQATVVFGDGIHGARLPTGVENVVARYRTGIWTTAVAAGGLSLLQQRPYGLRGVANPRASQAAVPPEGAGGARERAPRSVRTLGRVVSLVDYLDFARTYPGVGKATVTPLWTGSAHLAAITAAGVDGKPLSAALCGELATALATSAAPGQSASVDGYRPALFAVGAAILLAADAPPDLSPKEVLDAAQQALLDAFGPARRAFGQGVAASEVTTVLQNVPGVVAVDLRELHRESGEASAGLASFLPAAVASWDWQRGAVVPAELLIVDPAAIALTSEVAA
jgi:predicted phage baseplate assembly protein